jgi:hypothetical protein
MKLFKNQRFVSFINSIVCMSNLNKIINVTFDYPKTKKTITVNLKRVNLRYEFKL